MADNQIIDHVTKYAHVLDRGSLNTARQLLSKGLMDDIKDFYQIDHDPEYRGIWLLLIELSIAALRLTEQEVMRDD